MTREQSSYQSLSAQTMEHIWTLKNRLMYGETLLMKLAGSLNLQSIMNLETARWFDIPI